MKDIFAKKPGLLKPKKTIVLDWYDGIVTALIQFPDFDDWLLINLIAWDLNKKAKVYSLRAVRSQIFEKILDMFKDQQPNWPIWNPSKMTHGEFAKLEKLITEIYRTKGSEDYFLLSEDIQKGVESIKKILHAKVQRKASIDAVINMPNEEKQYWYELFK